MGELLLIAMAVIFIFLPITAISCMTLLGCGNFFITNFGKETKERIEEEKDSKDNKDDKERKKETSRFIGIFMLILEVFLGMIIGGAIKNILWLMIVGITLFISFIVVALLYFNSKVKGKS